MITNRSYLRFWELFCICFAISYQTFGESNGPLHVEYQSPVAGALYVTPETNIILRLSESVDGSDLRSAFTIRVEGSRTGVHAGRLDLSDDNRTILFKPARRFTGGEVVTVSFGRASRSETGPLGTRSGGEPLTFSFTTSRTMKTHGSGLRTLENEVSPGAGVPDPRSSYQAPKTAGDTLPLDFPYINISTSGNVAPGKIFLSNFKFFAEYVPYLLILDNSGAPVFYRRMKPDDECLDFKVQPNGLATYYDGGASKYYAMDTSYTIVDSFAVNGYLTDLHELRLLPNGHALMLAYDPQQVDMSQVAPGGSPTASVIGLIVQEIDAQKQPVFTWRSWDHFQITDATHENLTAPGIDYVHGNAIEIDYDGNLLLSCRHMDEITKINRSTGEIIWRLGGKHNEFTFLGDTLGFSHQHAIRRLPNGNITLYDNGNFHSPSFSRAAEYQLDEQQKTATLVWQYRNSPDYFGGAMGYVQRLDNGNTLIGWGATNPSVTEVAPDGTKLYELTLAPQMYSYRAFRFPWKEENTGGPSAVPTSYVLSQNYPNPFNGTTKIVLGLPEDAMVSFKVYDMLGRLINTQLDGELKSKGSYQLTFNGSSLPSGVYLYRLQIPGASQTRKMQLIR